MDNTSQAIYHVKDGVDGMLLDDLIRQLIMHYPVLQPAGLTVDLSRSDAGTRIHLTISSRSCDAYSLDRLGQQLLAGLKGAAANMPHEQISYMEYARWQNGLITGADADSLSFWNNYSRDGRKHFRFYAPSLSPRSAPAVHIFRLAPDVQKDMRRHFRGWEEEVLITSWLTVLARQNDGEAITIGYTTDARIFPEIRQTIGPVSRTLPLTVRLDRELDFRENMRLVKQGMEEVLTHQYAWSYQDPAFPVAFEYLSLRPPYRTEIELLISFRDYHTIKLTVVDEGEAILFQVQYDPGCYTQVAVEEISRQFVTVIGQALPDTEGPLDHIPLTGRSLPFCCNSLVEVLEDIVSGSGHQTAVTCNEKELTYAAMGALSDKLATALVSKYGIGPGDRIGVLMEPSETMPYVFMGVLKAGAAFVPLAPEEHLSVVDHIIRDSGCKILICDEQYVQLSTRPQVHLLPASELIREDGDRALLPECHPHFEACVLYTSPSGRSLRGLPLKHGALIDYVAWMRCLFDTGGPCSYAFMDIHHADPACLAMWPVWLSGGIVHIVPGYLEKIPEVLVRYLETRKVNGLHLTPSFFSRLLEKAPSGLHKLLLGVRLAYLQGETPDIRSLLQAWAIHPDLRILTSFILADVTDVVFFHEFDKNRSAYYQHRLPALPVPGPSVLVCDTRQAPCPPGIKGLIYVDGTRTALEGYWNAYHELEFIEEVTNDMQSVNEQIDPVLKETVRSVWKDVLHREAIADTDNFFQLGGDSIKAMQIASRLHVKGLLIQAREIFNHPTVSSLTRAVRPAATPVMQEAFEAAFPMTPVYHYFFETIKFAPHHHNQSMMLSLPGVEMADLERSIEKVVDGHDILRLTMRKGAGGEWVPFIRPRGFRPSIGYSEIDMGQKGWKEINRITREMQSGFDLFRGPLVQLHFFKAGSERLLFIVLHHLVTDLVSWNILLDDLELLLTAARNNMSLELPSATGSFGRWATRLVEYARDRTIQDQYEYWASIPEKLPFVPDRPEGDNYVRNLKTSSIGLDKEATGKLISFGSSIGVHGIQACILTALGLGLQQMLGIQEVLIMMESHGRQDLFEELNVHRTMGWFTALYPFLLRLDSPRMEENLGFVSRQLRGIPGDGIGYGLLRYLNGKEEHRLEHRPNIMFNYLGNQRGGTAHRPDRIVKVVDRQSGFPEDKDEKRAYEMDVISSIIQGEFRLHLSYSYEQFDEERINACVNNIKEALIRIIHSGNVLNDPPATLLFGPVTAEDIDSFFD